MKTNSIVIVLVSAMIPLLALGKEGEVKLHNGLAKDVRVVGVLNLKELEQWNWSPGSGAVPLSPEKAIEVADRFCQERLADKVHPVIRELRLISLNVKDRRRWYWLAIYPGLDREEQIKGVGTPVPIPISFGGVVMAEVRAIEKGNKPPNKP